jgi:hypothetical protein
MRVYHGRFRRSCFDRGVAGLRQARRSAKVHPMDTVVEQRAAAFF